jgi:RNA polymerase sigma factor (sigma-70 family)
MSYKPTLTAKEKFDVAIQAFLKPNHLEVEENISYAKLKNFIKRNLQQFNLHNIEVNEVVHITYLRGVKLIEDGEEIKNPIAWIRVTSFNVIRELSRKQKKHQPVDSNSIEYQMDLQQLSYDFTLEDADDADIKLLKLALQKLEPKDRQLLVLWKVEDLSWKEVVKRLASCGEVVSEATARQRGKRALERLRKVYGCMKPVKLSTTAL